MDAEGKKVAVKDSWREAGRQSEGEILKNILASCEKKLQPDELANAKRHFIGVRLWQDVAIDHTRDETPMVAEEHNRTWVSIDLNPTLSTNRHLSSKGDVPDSGQLSALFSTQLGIIAPKIPRRVHTRTVFYDVGVALKDVTSLADNLTCLSGALMGEQTTVTLLSQSLIQPKPCIICTKQAGFIAISASGTQFGSRVWGSWVTSSTRKR
jgi:hypothetical protein